MTAPVHSKISRHRNSWYLKTGTIHHFICKCGEVDQYDGGLISNLYHPHHHCSSCGNRHFLDSSEFLYNGQVKYWSIFCWQYRSYQDLRGWHTEAVAVVPHFDTAIQKIRLRSYVIARSSLYPAGKRDTAIINPVIAERFVYNGEKTRQKIAECIKSEIAEKHFHFITANPSEKIDWMAMEMFDGLAVTEKMEALSFFLQYAHLKEFDFYYWKEFASFEEMSRAYPAVVEMLHQIFNRKKEKSIRRAYFAAYQEAIASGAYNPKTDYIFSRVIEDRNHLVKLIQIDPRIKQVLFDGIRFELAYAFFAFLDTHYSAVDIIKLFTSLTPSMLSIGTVQDSLRMFGHERMEALLAEHFQKPKPDFELLHDEFVRLGRFYKRSLKGKIVFDYPSSDLEAECTLETFSYRLPKTIHQLDNWSRHLHNCMFSYAREIHHGQTIIYGVFVEEKLSYAVEIRNHHIVQALGKFNRRIDTEDRKRIDSWFREVYLKALIGS